MNKKIIFLIVMAILIVGFCAFFILKNNSTFIVSEKNGVELTIDADEINLLRNIPFGYEENKFNNSLGIISKKTLSKEIRIDCQYVKDNPTNILQSSVIKLCEENYPNLKPSKECKFKIGDIVSENSEYGKRFWGGVVTKTHKRELCVYEISVFSNYMLSDNQLENETTYPHNIEINKDDLSWMEGDWMISFKGDSGRTAK